MRRGSGTKTGRWDDVGGEAGRRRGRGEDGARGRGRGSRVRVHYDLRVFIIFPYSLLDYKLHISSIYRTCYSTILTRGSDSAT